MNNRLTLIEPNQDRASTEQDEDVIDLRALAMTLWHGRMIILVCALFGIAIGFLAASQIVPQYQATAKLLLGTEQANVMKDKSVLVDSSFGDTTLQTHIEILQSVKLIDRVVEKLNLDEAKQFQSKSPEELSALQKTKAWFRGLFRLPPVVSDLLIDIGLKSAPPPPPTEEEAKELRRRGLITEVEAGMSLSPVKDSRVIEVSYTSEDPHLAAKIANEITQQYLVDQLEGKLETTRNAMNWLSDQVEQMQTKVSTAEQAVQDAYAKLSTQSGQSLEVTQQQIQSLNGALAVARNELSDTEAKYARLNQAVQEGRDFGALTEFRDSPIIAGFRKQESELKSQLAALQGTVPAGHPALLRLQSQIDEVRQNIRDEASRLLQSIEVDLETKRAAEQNLTTQIRDLEDTAARQSKDAIAIKQLEREAEASRVLYESLLSRLKETSAEETLQTVDARVISSAEVPDAPSGNAVNRTRLLYSLVGIMAGVGIVILLDKLNNTVRSPNQLEQLTGCNVLGTVPQVGKSMKRSDVVDILRSRPNSALAESIRNLRTSILFSNVDNPPRVVMFTSSVPREGKSTTSMLMALTSRQMGKSAIIVDCDLRMPALSKVIKVDAQKRGLLSVIDNSVALEDAIYVEPETGLHILMSQPAERGININAADILASHRFHDLIARLAQAYDLVILDTPPTLVVTDARIVSSMADSVVFVVRWDSTPKSAVVEGLRELTSVKAKIAGLTLTIVNEAKATKYAYDGYSYHKGRYRDYYDL